MEELYDKIERFLSGRMADEEQEAFEKALQSDESLAAEVALHQQLNGFLEDTGELRLRANLSEIGEAFTAEYVKEAKLGRAQLNIIGLIFFFLTLALMVFFFFFYNNNGHNLSEDDSLLEGPTSRDVPAVQEPSNDTTTIFEPSRPVDIPKEPREEATADQRTNQPPRDKYAVFPALETLLQRPNRVKRYEFDLDALLTGQAPPVFTIKGELLAVSVPESGFVLKVFDNITSNYPDDPVLVQNLRVVPKEEEERPMAFAAKKLYSVVSTPLSELQAGLYYYLIYEKDQLLYVGKFER